MKLWIFCPVYHDTAAFLKLRENTLRELRELRLEAGPLSVHDIHFVFIDDSAGEDPDVAAARQLPDVIVVTPPFNLGHQRALVHAIRAMALRIDDRDWVLTMDADGEDSPSDIPRLVNGHRQRFLDTDDPAASEARLRVIVLARRTTRHETLLFKVLYLFFKAFYSTLTGLVVQTGNFALYRGWAARHLLVHPSFDVCYSATLLRIAADPVFVPCARASRYQGRSKMGYTRLISHGIAMLVPFADIVATRLFVAFSAVCALSVVGLVALALPDVPPSRTWVVALVISAGASAVLTGICLALFAGVFMYSQATLSRRLATLEMSESRPRVRGAV